MAAWLSSAFSRLLYNWGLTEKTRVFKYYDLLASIFIVVLVISNLLGQKICAFGPFRVSGAQLLFPITYIFGDIFTEVYGYGGSRRIIWIGFLANAVMAGLGQFDCRAAGRAGMEESGSVRDRISSGAQAGDCKPDRVLVRRVRQFIRAGQNEVDSQRAAICGRAPLDPPW